MSDHLVTGYVSTMFRTDEVFRDGFESMFGLELTEAVKNHGSMVIHMAGFLILDGRCSDDVAVEALSVLSEIDHDETYEQRRALIEYALLVPSARVRDGAGNGIANMDDTSSIPALEEAARIEKNKTVRNNLENVLAQLYDTALG